MQTHQHGHAPVGDLSLAPPLQVTDSSVAGASVGQEAQGVKDVGEWLGDAWHRLLQEQIPGAVVSVPACMRQH